MAFRCIILIIAMFFPPSTDSLSCNWGTRSTHPLNPDIVVKLMKDNGFDKVKFFEPDSNALEALGNSNIEVMIGIPNELLSPLAASVTTAENWIRQNVSYFISKFGVDIRYVAVGNEPFLKSYQDKYVQSTFPALQNIQAAIIKAGISSQVKVTVPINADVYQSANGLPSGGDFRDDIHTLILSIIKFLSENNSPLTINIYPFLSLYADPNFPADYAFFSGNAAPVVDGAISYTNVFDANLDTLIWALQRNGFSNMSVIVGEVGWPSDGDQNANPALAQKFNQGLLNRIIKGQGTPMRPNPPDIYLFALIDEDAKSIDPGNFERHWGIFYYDGSLKYPLQLQQGQSLAPAKGVRYLTRHWCVMASGANALDPNVVSGMDYACSYADCTSLRFGSSCGQLDQKNNASYAFNQYYQTLDQRSGSCKFSNLATVTTVDPSRGSCRFNIMIDNHRRRKASNHRTTSGVRRNSAFSKLATYVGVALLFLQPLLWVNMVAM